jgi:hypothetical protein
VVRLLGRCRGQGGHERGGTPFSQQIRWLVIVFAILESSECAEGVATEEAPPFAFLGHSEHPSWLAPLSARYVVSCGESSEDREREGRDDQRWFGDASVEGVQSKDGARAEVGRDQSVAQFICVWEASRPLWQVARKGATRYICTRGPKLFAAFMHKHAGNGEGAEEAVA